MLSPYAGIPVDNWQNVTRFLIQDHPLNVQDLLQIVEQAWAAISTSQIGRFHIGVEIFPKPQILGFFLHELIALEISNRYPDVWQRDQHATDKDLMYLPNQHYSIEIKTSSSQHQIYGNRSYAQASDRPQKGKSGYYLAINFEKLTPETPQPHLRLVRFGWLDHDDWLGQAAPTGQQARLHPDAERHKLLRLPLLE